MVPLRPVSKISPPCESIPVQAAIGEREHHSRCTKEIGEPARQRELAEALLKKVQADREDRGKPACGSRVTQQTADTAREIKKTPSSFIGFGIITYKDHLAAVAD